MQAEVSVELLVQIIESVFVTMMDLEVSLCEAPLDSRGERLTSFIHLTGDWNGAVLFECSSWQACQFTGRILAMDPPPVLDDDVRDALGELANMIGGNMKSALAAGVSLSMPTVMEGLYDMRICRSRVLEKVNLQCAEGQFCVTVLASEI